MIARSNSCGVIGGDDLGSVAEQLTETTVLQRPVVEVGAQRGDDTDPTLVVGHRAHEGVEEPVRRGRVDLCEQLLELVDQQQQLRAVVRQHAAKRALQPVLARELLEQGGGRIDGNAEQCIFERLERMGRRGHLDREPRIRQGERAATDRREQPGLHDARLAAPARADHGDESAAGPGLTETGDEPLDEPFPAVEVDGIGDVERPQPLVRVVDLDLRRRSWSRRSGVRAQRVRAPRGDR